MGKTICVTVAVVVGLLVAGSVIKGALEPDTSSEQEAIEALRAVASAAVERSGSSGTSSDAAMILACGCVAGCGLIVIALMGKREERDSPARGETHHNRETREIREIRSERLVIVVDPSRAAEVLSSLPGSGRSAAYEPEPERYFLPVTDEWGRTIGYDERRV